jgi:hypothetical protein
MKIAFIYKHSQRAYGSIFMRAHQAKTYFNEHKDLFSGKAISYPIGSRSPVLTYKFLIKQADVFIFTKEAIKLAIPLVELRSSNKKYNKKIIGSDILDMDINTPELKLADFLISSSFTQTQYLNFSYSSMPIISWPHHTDLRVSNNIPEKKDKNIAYFGAPENFQNIKLDGQQIDYLEVRQKIVKENILKLASRYKFHLCNRPLNQITSGRIHKPPTKIITAASMNALPIIDEDNINALEVLGYDYPFVISQNDVDLQTLSALISEGDSSAEYYDALHRLSLIRRRYHPRELVKHFTTQIKKLLNAF